MQQSRLKKILTYRFTFLMVPHGAAQPRQISIHLSFLLIVALLWTGVTAWGSYLSARHVDYWRTEVSNEVLKMKVKYLLAQVDQVHGYLDEVKTVDSQLRELLKYQKGGVKTASAVEPASLDAGGPTVIDQTDLSRSLDSLDPDLSWQRLMDRATTMRQEAKERITSYEDLTRWIETQKQIFTATPRGWPCLGPITSRYGQRMNPFQGEGLEFHPGLDISGAVGTPVRATADGVVRVASWKTGYGNLIVLQHDYGFQTRFGHNSRILVRVGDRVRRGQAVALMGATGRASGPHCHYEVWRYNQRKNPAEFLKEDPTGTAAILTRDIPHAPVAEPKKGV